MTRNIMTGEGVKPVEAVTEFEVSGILIFKSYQHQKTKRYLIGKS